MTTDEPWMRPYVLSITGLFLEEGFARLAEALGRLDNDAAETALARFEEMIQAQIAEIGEQDDIPAAVLIGLRRNIEIRMAAVFVKARQRLAVPSGQAGPSPSGQVAHQGLMSAPSSASP